jgi:hypothetical protein
MIEQRGQRAASYALEHAERLTFDGQRGSAVTWRRIAKAIRALQGSSAAMPPWAPRSVPERD